MAARELGQDRSRRPPSHRGRKVQRTSAATRSPCLPSAPLVAAHPRRWTHLPPGSRVLKEAAAAALCLAVAVVVAGPGAEGRGRSQSPNNQSLSRRFQKWIPKSRQTTVPGVLIVACRKCHTHTLKAGRRNLSRCNCRGMLFEILEAIHLPPSPVVYTPPRVTYMSLYTESTP